MVPMFAGVSLVRDGDANTTITPRNRQLPWCLANCFPGKAQAVCRARGRADGFGVPEPAVRKSKGYLIKTGTSAPRKHGRSSTELSFQEMRKHRVGLEVGAATRSLVAMQGHRVISDRTLRRCCLLVDWESCDRELEYMLEVNGRSWSQSK